MGGSAEFMERGDPNVLINSLFWFQRRCAVLVFSAWVDENRKIIDVKLKTFGCGSNEDTIVLQVSQ